MTSTNICVAEITATRLAGTDHLLIAKQAPQCTPLVNVTVLGEMIMAQGTTPTRGGTSSKQTGVRSCSTGCQAKTQSTSDERATREEDAPLQRDVEVLERTAFEMVVQAVSDYLLQTQKIYREEDNNAQNIAEDVTREAMDSMGVPSIHERLYGKADYKRAMYIFVPEARPVALMLDAKTEESDGTATIQKSETSMEIAYLDRNGNEIREEGSLQREIVRNKKKLHVVSVIAKYAYSDFPNGGYDLDEVVLACIPNGILQGKYNPNPESTIWRAGSRAPTLGEEFCVRLDFAKLQDREQWRVRRLRPKEREENT